MTFETYAAIVLVFSVVTTLLVTALWWVGQTR